MKPAPPVTRYRMRFTDLRRVAELNELRDDPVQRCTSQASRSGGKCPPAGCRVPATHVSRSGGFAPHGREIVLPVRQRSEEHTSELQSRPHLVCRLLLEKKKKHTTTHLASAVRIPSSRGEQRVRRLL